jgi:hypothetical protein
MEIMLLITSCVVWVLVDHAACLGLGFVVLIISLHVDG